MEALTSDRPDSQPPFFFRRVWAGGTDMDEVTVFERLPDGTLLVRTDIPLADLPSEQVADVVEATPDGLVIYGRAIAPAADAAYIARMADRGQVFAECFSVVCPEGEVGCHPLAAITEISRAEFEAARDRGWKP